MNTPAHAVVGLALFAAPDGQRRPRDSAAILFGSLLPDLPMFGFFIWQRFLLGTAHSQIWDVEYFRASSQAFFDVFNSIPLALVGLALALWQRHRTASLVCAGVLAHCALDLPLHREDGHGHFWPLSDWHFVSPVSYWDPRHHGRWGALLEVAATVAATLRLWPRYRGALARGLLVGASALAAVGWTAFYGLRLVSF